MSDPVEARILHRVGCWPGPSAGVVSLDHDARFLRRKRLVTESGESLLVDLPETVGLEHGDAFELADGRLIEIAAAEEPLLAVTGDLARLAWHIGNRHTPCEIQPGRLLIRDDHVLEGMLRGLGAHVTEVVAPFRPEGGAYGLGRTMGHEHGPEVHANRPAHVLHHGAHLHTADDDETPAEPE
ncbi:urease accessory protein UreE [Paracoccaceae bacterium Fryx2]|nr:urease accessory protein UreE [Paracoccaceae bacterium Fryx2]